MQLNPYKFMTIHVKPHLDILASHVTQMPPTGVWIDGRYRFGRDQESPNPVELIYERYKEGILNSYTVLADYDMLFLTSKICVSISRLLEAYPKKENEIRKAIDEMCVELAALLNRRGFRVNILLKSKYGWELDGFEVQVSRSLSNWKPQTYTVKKKRYSTELELEPGLHFIKVSRKFWHFFTKKTIKYVPVIDDREVELII